jgi:hypothetical protein
MDFDNRLGRKALRKLKGERVLWLTSVDEQSRPQPRPVWEAHQVREAVAAERMKAYLRKYRSGIVDLEMTPASFQAEYSVPILVRPTALRGS